MCYRPFFEMKRPCCNEKANERLQGAMLSNINDDPYCQTFRNCQQCYRKLQKARTIIKLENKENHCR